MSCGREVYNVHPIERRTLSQMRRLLVALTLTLLLIVSAGVGILVAYWPRWAAMLD